MSVLRMIQPCRAAVRPRVVCPETGDIVLLEDEVAAWLEGKSRTLRIVGGPGSGKTTALRQLAAVFGPRDDVILVDNGGSAPESVLSDPRRLIYSTSASLPDRGDPILVSLCDSRPEEAYKLQLASWNEDDLLEYCLARHRQKCGSVMARIRAMRDARRLHGVPELWTLVIDAFADDEDLNDWRIVLRNELANNLPEPFADRVREYCLSSLLDLETAALAAMRVLTDKRGTSVRASWLKHRAVQLLLSADQVVRKLEEGRKPAFLGADWPFDLVDETAALLAQSPKAWPKLVDVMASKHERYHSVAATLLHAMGQGWQPPPRTKANLSAAVFTGAVWPGIDLSHARLQKVDFSGADLSAAQLDHVFGQEMRLSGAVLTEAWLRGAKMRGAKAQGANLTEMGAMNSSWQYADFRNACLHGANLCGSDLQHADFTDANLSASGLSSAKLSGAILDRANCSGADFRNATLRRVCLSTAVLTDTRFDRADLREADLEDLHWPAANLEKANLTRAYLTGSVMPGARLQGAILCEAGLADIDWEGADLRDADFSNCAFHLGSSRSGLVGSPIACEGSRTGFYTDDFLEQDFKSPEEIRKANLRGADLRGAIVEKADFYLVDLRGARYTPGQADHFRRCGAILVDRVQRA